jgi:soluble lytic murein transglycosylase-like protein
MINKLKTKEFIKEAVSIPPPKPIPQVINKNHHYKFDSDTLSNFWYNILELEKLENAHNLPKHILKYIIQKESEGNPAALSARGAKGLFQLIPIEKVNPLDNLKAASHVAEKLSRDIKDLGSIKLALASYNWGRHNVINKGLEQAPLQTKDYLDFFKKNGIIKE